MSKAYYLVSIYEIEEASYFRSEVNRQTRVPTARASHQSTSCSIASTHGETANEARDKLVDRIRNPLTTVSLFAILR